MKSLVTTLLLALLPACASGPQPSPIMAVMATTWSVVVVPNVQEAVAGETLTPEQHRAITATLASVQRMLDSGESEVALDIFNEWRSMRSFAEMGIRARVEAGKLDPAAGVGLVELLRQFEIQLTRLLAR